MVYIDCGTPSVTCGVVIEPFNNTQLDATIIFHCDEGLIPQTITKAVCGSTGVWNPDPAFHSCVNQSSGKSWYTHGRSQGDIYCCSCSHL